MTQLPDVPVSHEVANLEWANQTAVRCTPNIFGMPFAPDEAPGHYGRGSRGQIRGRDQRFEFRLLQRRVRHIPSRRDAMYRRQVGTADASGKSLAGGRLSQ